MASGEFFDKAMVLQGQYPQYPQYGGYQQQPVYVQPANQGYGGGSSQQGCMEGCLAALCCLFALEACFLF